ncbi:MAG: hybrid sensor histidine kinase/response regulator [Magnetococcales bacterium]|nr:hybrid sensor histidine kinase/response regulator [Magnetococcales bacterium]
MNHSAEKSKILIVDDVPGNIRTLVAILGAEYKLLVATDGPTALSIAREKELDLILLDVVMPEMDGYEVCQTLKSDAATRGIPVIFVTARSDVTDELKALELGAVDFLTKPVSPPVVMARVKTHLGLKRANEALERQNKELREAAKLREEVERIMRHDLKTPLNSIIGFSSFLSTDTDMNSEQEHMLKIIVDNGYSLLNMINLSMDIYKMERGSYSLDPKPVDIMDLIRRIRETSLKQFTRRNLQLEVLLDGHPSDPSARFLIVGEELLCYSMLGNLFNNALEAAPKGSIVTIAMDRGQAGEISIHNMGSVPEEIRADFFEKYTTAGKAGGTGLGTYSAKLMAETQRGSIHLDTSEERGTTVTVRLPLA